MTESEPPVDLIPYTDEEIVLRKKVNSADYADKLKDPIPGEKPCLGFFCIMRQEEKNIIKMLETLVPHIDCACICDTGSTDHSVEVVEEFFKKTVPDIPLTIFHDKWHDFGHNRSLSVRHLWETYPQATYALTCDPDMRLIVDPKFDKRSLTKGRYSIEQKSVTTRYFNIRILRRGRHWISKGRTHECYDCKGDEYTTDDIDPAMMSMDDKEDGGCKSSKFIRDLRLLTMDMEESKDYGDYWDPSEKAENKIYWEKYGAYSRTLYYLAQTNRSLDKHEDAMEWYKKRAALSNSYEEEGWFAEYSVAGQLVKLERFGDAREQYMKAYRRRPHRAEPLHDLAEMCRRNSDNLSAYNYALEALEIKWPGDDKLFVDIRAHTWGPNYTLSICSYYLDRFRKGILASFDVYGSTNVPDWIKKQVVNNIVHYFDKIGFNGCEFSMQYLLCHSTTTEKKDIENSNKKNGKKPTKRNQESLPETTSEEPKKKEPENPSKKNGKKPAKRNQESPPETTSEEPKKKEPENPSKKKWKTHERCNEELESKDN